MHFSEFNADFVKKYAFFDFIGFLWGEISTINKKNYGLGVFFA